MLLMKLKMILGCSLLAVIVHGYSAEELNFFQNDYDVTMDIAEIFRYNKSCIKNAKAGLVPYNRTQRVLNVTFELLINMGSDIIEEVQVYKFMSNEYRFFPLTFKANVCVEYMKNSFGAKEIGDKTSNFTPCNMKKGIYYMHNMIPDFSKFPPRMPHGSYKLVVEFLFQKAFCVEIDLYGKIVDKPVDWKRIPTSKTH